MSLIVDTSNPVKRQPSRVADSATTSFHPVRASVTYGLLFTFAKAIRSSTDGCVANSQYCQDGGSNISTFCLATFTSSS